MSENTKAELERAKRDEVEMMLPFYVTGQLDQAEANEIDDYLERHPDVARQLEFIRAERESTVAGNAIYASRPAKSFDRVAAMIGKTPAKPAPAAGSWLDLIKQLFTMPSSPALGFVGAAAAIVILLQAATIGTLVVAQYPNIFTGASGGNGTVDAGTTVVVQFSDNASAVAIADLLSGLGVKIIDGPSGGKLFTVRIGPKNMSEGDRERLIAALKARRDLIVFVTQKS
jgi:anti-sigma factor RsiW